MPNADIIWSTHTGDLPIKELESLSRTAIRAHVIPNIHHSLISVGVLCDDDCLVAFHKRHAYVIKNNKILLRGDRVPNGLWTLRPTTATEHQANVMRAKDVPLVRNRIKDHLRFLHATCFSPTLSTWVQAVKNNNFVTWPAVTVKNIQKHMDTPPATVKGHLDQLRKKYKVNEK